jgi:hypothetical protein
VGRRDVPGPSTDFSVTDGLRWIGHKNSVAEAISQNSSPAVPESVFDWGRKHMQRSVLPARHG